MTQKELELLLQYYCNEHDVEIRIDMDVYSTDQNTFKIFESQKKRQVPLFETINTLLKKSAKKNKKGV